MSSNAVMSNQIEEAFEHGWKLINLVSDWHSDKSTSLACETVDRVEWRQVQELTIRILTKKISFHYECLGIFEVKHA